MQKRINTNPIALRKAKTLWRFDHSECNMVKRKIIYYKKIRNYFELNLLQMRREPDRNDRLGSSESLQ